MSRFRASRNRLLLCGSYGLVLAILGGATLHVLAADGGADHAPLELVAPAAVTRSVQPPRTMPSALISAEGVAQPARAIRLASPISGRLHSVHHAMEPGGIIPAGESLWTLETREFEARLRGAQSSLADTVAQYQIEQGRARAARREWDALGMSESTTDHRDRSIALREFQAAEIAARMGVAKAEVDLAEIELARCTASLDVDFAVLEESIEPGSWIASEQHLVTGMEAGRWHIVVLLTPAQADAVRDMEFESVPSDVRVLGSLGEPLPAEIVRWLPGDTGRPQMQGLLLRVRTDRPGILWAGARVQVTLRPHETHRRDTPASSVGLGEVLTDGD